MNGWCTTSNDWSRVPGVGVELILSYEPDCQGAMCPSEGRLNQGPADDGIGRQSCSDRWKAH